MFMLLEVKVLPCNNPLSRGLPPRIIVLQCDVCQSKYERKYSAHYFKEIVNRCSVKCAYGSRSSDGVGGHGAQVFEKPCGTCSKTLKRVESGTRSNQWFCDIKCYAKWRAEHPEMYAENTAKMHTPESAKKISQKARERMSQPGYVHSQTGLKRSDSTRNLIRQHHIDNPMTGDKNGMWGRKHTNAARNKMSDAVSQRVLAGTHQPYGTRNKKGYYTSTRDEKERFFRSSWEQKMMVWLDAATDVVSWDYECVRIPYQYNENKRWYVPDFLVTFQDGHKELWEVKPKEFVNAEKNKLKEQASNEWCQQNNVLKYRVLTGDDLRQMKVL